MKVDAIDHIVLTVRDIDATCDFYQGVLGMTVISFGEGRRALRFGSQKINLHPYGNEFEPKAERPTPGSRLGGPLLCHRHRSRWHSQPPCRNGHRHRGGAGGSHRCARSIASFYLRDPDGNLVELSSYQAAQ